MSRVAFEVEDWSQSVDPDPRCAVTMAEFVLRVDGLSLTRLFDSWSRTVTDRARLPLYPLAQWLAANWWRLRAEAPEEGWPSPDWRLSHDLPAIGGGYVWPNVRFASDGPTIQISARTARAAPWEPVRHLADLTPARGVAVEDWDRAVAALIEQVLGRLHDLGVSSEPLATIWSDVRAERQNPEIAEWRQWEARLGFDPDAAPEDVMPWIEALVLRAGRAAAVEVAPLLSPERSAFLHRIEEVARRPGLEATLPSPDQAVSWWSDAAPWDAGRDLAHRVRNHAQGPLSDADLLALLGAPSSSFRALVPSDLPLGLGVRTDGGSILHFRKRNPVGRRFEAARFLAESLSAPPEDRWLPLTDRATARQKFQRAFAIELLAPIDEMRERIGDAPTPDRIEDVAEDYGVSPLAVRSHLANNGLLSPDEVSV